MSLIPAETVSAEDMIKWQELQETLKKVKAQEMLLRLKIYKHFFTDPVEGTNNHPLAAGWVLKGKRVIDRKVELATLQAMSIEGGPLHLAGIRPASMIKWEPSLVLAEYRTLTEEQKQVFDQCLIIKDGSPAIEIVLPAAAKKAEEARQAVAMGLNPTRLRG